MSGKLFASAMMLGMAAFWLAQGVGIPSWSWSNPGDAADIGLCVFAAILLLGSRP